MSEMMEYKCPQCGGAIEFNVSAQRVKCLYCDTEFDMEVLKAYDKSLNKPEDDFQWDTQAGQAWSDAEREGMKVFVCQSCGGEVVGDVAMAASKCPYCDSPVIIKGAFAGDLKPDYVIPFKYDKKAAVNAFKMHLLDKKLLPKAFRDESRIEEVKGIYVPFWLFDTSLDASVDYDAVKQRFWSDDEYDYEERSHYHVVREGSMAFNTIPVDGSTKMADELMESLEPFDFKDAVDFQTAYLSGYLADKYDVSVEESIERINSRVRNSAVEVLERTVQGYSFVNMTNSSIQLRDSSSKYALYPVWLLNIKWNGKMYTFAMNGQTGKFVGDLPLDKGEETRMRFKWFGLLSIVGFVVALLTVLI